MSGAAIRGQRHRPAPNQAQGQADPERKVHAAVAHRMRQE